MKLVPMNGVQEILRGGFKSKSRFGSEFIL